MAVAILAILAAGVQLASAKCPHGKPLILLGTTGACNSVNPGDPCTETSTLVQLDPMTGALIRVIGPVGFTVNGLAWDDTSGKLYATTAVGCGPDSVCPFHGLITINPHTGRGKPVNKKVVNFGLSGNPSPIHSITIDESGDMVGWYTEFPPPDDITDTFVRINKKNGVATEFPNTGLIVAAHGLSYDVSNYLWNIDRPRNAAQTIYLLDPVDGKPLFSKVVTPPAVAALGDFNPENNLYYGINFNNQNPKTFILVVDPRKGTVTQLGQTVDDLHVLAFIPADD